MGDPRPAAGELGGTLRYPNRGCRFLIPGAIAAPIQDRPKSPQNEAFLGGLAPDHRAPLTPHRSARSSGISWVDRDRPAANLSGHHYGA